MSLKTYAVTVGAPGGPSRVITVASPTDVQAGDAARPLMSETESILKIAVEHGDSAAPDAGPPRSQAAELAPVTPGVAAVTEPGRETPGEWPNGT